MNALSNERILQLYNENLVVYFEGAADDMKVMIFVHGKTVVYGISDLNKYKKIFGNILQNFKHPNIMTRLLEYIFIINFL